MQASHITPLPYYQHFVPTIYHRYRLLPHSPGLLQVISPLYSRGIPSSYSASLPFIVLIAAIGHKIFMWFGVQSEGGGSLGEP